MADRKNRMERVTVRIPKRIVRDIEHLGRAGLYPNRSEVIRDACRRLLIELGGEDHDIDVGLGPPAGTGSTLERVRGHLEPQAEVEKRREWRLQDELGDVSADSVSVSKPTGSLDHDSDEDLEEAYRDAGGNITEAAEQFDVCYATVRQRLIDAGLHEPETYETAGSTAEVAADGGESR